jgi:hypothetical protein
VLQISEESLIFAQLLYQENRENKHDKKDSKNIVDSPCSFCGALCRRIRRNIKWLDRLHATGRRTGKS